MTGAAFRFFDSQQPLYRKLQNQIPITPVDAPIPGNDKGHVFGLFTAADNIYL